MRDLPSRLFVERPIAFRRACPGELVEQALLALARGHGETREAVAQVVQGESAALRDGARGVQDGRTITEKLRHVCGRLQVTFAVVQEAAADGVHAGFFAHASQHVVDTRLFRPGVAHVVGGHQRQAQCLGLRHGCAIDLGLFIVEMALHLQVQPVGAEDLCQPLQIGSRGRPAESDEPAFMLGQPIERGRAWAR